MEETSTHKRDLETISDDLTQTSPSEKRLRSKTDLLLLDIFDDDDNNNNNNNDSPTEHDGLASVIKSLEQEITLNPLNNPLQSEPLLQPDLDYLLEASDDELGLPPTGNSYEKDVDAGFGQMWGFADGVFSEWSACDDFGGWNGEFFGYGEDEMGWRQETLPAV